MRAFRYRAYPSELQMSFLRQIGGCTRLVRNLALEQRRAFGRRGRWFSYKQQAAELKALKAEAPFLKDAPHHCLQAALRDLNGAYERFVAGQAGYPRPRGKHDGDSFRFPDKAQFRLEPSADRRSALLRLPKMGRRPGCERGPLRLRLDRPLAGQPRSVTVSFEADHVYVSVLCAVEVEPPQAPTGPAIGLDFGVVVPVMRSDGVAPYVPVPTARQQERQRRLQRALSRRKQGSANRSKARRALARHAAAAARRRRDALHKLTTALAHGHRRIWIEDLRVRAMTASARGSAAQPGRNVAAKAGLNRAILAVGWGLARRMLEYKCGWSRAELRLRPAPYTSQTCSACWHVDARSRVSRDLFRCVACGHTRQADWNAALVVLGRDENTPEDTYSGSACGALCSDTATKQEIRSARARNPGIHAGE